MRKTCLNHIIIDGDILNIKGLNLQVGDRIHLSHKNFTVQVMRINSNRKLFLTPNGEEYRDTDFQVLVAKVRKNGKVGVKTNSFTGEVPEKLILSWMGFTDNRDYLERQGLISYEWTPERKMRAKQGILTIRECQELNVGKDILEHQIMWCKANGVTPKGF
tara:strand:- start:3851 stop:4333 length:483 start_codon:yes stop_codon:yes gene_type:complete